MNIITTLQQKNFIASLPHKDENEKVSIHSSALQFAEEVVVAAKNKIVDFIKTGWQHIESIVILTLSSFGLSALLGELPFWFALPWWIEATMVIPVFSVLFIYALVKSAERRAKARMAVA